MRVAYVGHDRVLRVHDTLSPGDEDLALSVPGLRCNWPVWSLDGERVAFSGYSGDETLGVYITGYDNPGPGLIYSNEVGTGEIARATPHYCSWAPDGSRLAFVAQTISGLSLFVWDGDSRNSPRVAQDGGPMYFTWSPDSSQIYTHSFLQHYLIDVSEEALPQQFPGRGTQYMSPSWGREGDGIAFFLDGEHGKQRLVVINLKDSSARMLTEFYGLAAVAWRPGYAQLGMVKETIRNTGFYSGLWLVDYETREEVQLSDDPALAFYWSPDGSKAAYVTQSDGAEGSLRFGVVEVESGELTYLSDFTPSQEQLIHFMFFDQYAQSHPVWSPDSSALLVCGQPGYQLIRSELPMGESNRVMLLDADGKEAPRDLAGGFIGCWGRDAV
ncbi:MAG: hypothetical protein F4Y49_01215 [Dehalococcoidia bacterium]|nr:hypothetical protein [Dehalococcoidia bacterium]